MSNAFAAAAKARLLAQNIVTHGITGESRTLVLRRGATGSNAVIATVVNTWVKKKIRDTFANSAQQQAGVNFVWVFEVNADALTEAEAALVAVIVHDGFDYSVTLGEEPEGRKQSYKFKVKSKKKTEV